MLKILSWTKNYEKSKLKGDFFAGITTGVMLIPQGMAYALIAGLPPVYGLYAALIPPIFYVLSGTSYQLSVGPVATVSLLVFAGLGELHLSGQQLILSAALLAFLVGLIQLVFGISRLGFIANFLSRPVISGYTSAAAIIICLSQAKNLMGIQERPDSIAYEALRQTILDIDKTDLPTFYFGCGALIFLLLVRHVNPKLPAPIFAVALSILTVYLFTFEQTVKIVGNIPSGLPSFQSPEFSQANVKKLAPLALIIALVSFLESISISKTLQTRHKDYMVNANSELVALGMANLAGSFFRAFPTSGGFSRSVVNEQAGANTPLAVVISSALIALTLLFLTPVFYYLPQSVLAAIIIAAVVRLINIKEAVALWKVSQRDFWMMMVTLAATLGLGIREGIITGVVLSMGLVIYKSAYPHTAILGKLPDSNYYRNITRFPEAKDRDDAIVFRFDSQLYFANIQYFIDTLCSFIAEKEKTLKVIVVNAQAINEIDVSAMYGLRELLLELKKRGYVIYFTEVIGPVRDALKKSGLYDLAGREHFHMRVQDALDHFDSRNGKNLNYAWQTNE